MFSSFYVGDFKDELTSFHKDMRTRYGEQMAVANSVMISADNSYWRCDPPKHVAEQTYTEFKHLVQVRPTLVQHCMSCGYS